MNRSEFIFATAAIIFLFATAGPKGFAFTLLVGTLISFFTAIFATRAVFEVIADTKLMRDDRLLGTKSKALEPPARRLRQRSIRSRKRFGAPTGCESSAAPSPRAPCSTRCSKRAMPMNAAWRATS